MTALMFFGCTFISFGPALALFVLTVAKDAQQVIVLITSAFFWLLSLLLSSIWWMVVSPLKKYLIFGVAFSVLFQELFRLGFWKLLKRAEEGLITIAGSHSPLRKYHFHYVSGLGFGLMSGLFAMVNVLADITGPGTIGLYGDNENFLLVTAFLTNCFILLHTFWGILFYDALEKQDWTRAVIVVFSHMMVSLLTVFNNRGLPVIPLTVNHVVLVCMGLWAFRIAGGSIRNVKRTLFSR